MAADFTVVLLRLYLLGCKSSFCFSKALRVPLVGIVLVSACVRGLLLSMLCCHSLQLLKCKIEVAEWSFSKGVMRAQSLVLKRISVPEAYVRKAIHKLSLGSDSPESKNKDSFQCNEEQACGWYYPGRREGCRAQKTLVNNIISLLESLLDVNSRTSYLFLSYWLKRTDTPESPLVPEPIYIFVREFCFSRTRRYTPHTL